MAFGMAFIGGGILWATQIPVNGNFWHDLAGPLFVTGVGTAFAFIPVSIGGLAGVTERDAGVASGLLNTSQQLGGAIGVAVASSIVASRLHTLIHHGHTTAAALTGGFQWALWVCGLTALPAIPLTFALIRRTEMAKAAATTQPTQAGLATPWDDATPPGSTDPVNTNQTPQTAKETQTMPTSTSNVAEARHTGPAAIADKSVLVTGANRGLGQALVDEALLRGAKRVYAASRQPFTHPDERVIPLALDVTDAAQIQTAAERVESLDILINNAGVSVPDDLTDRAAFDQHFAVNLFGTWAVTEAFLPLLTKSSGIVVNVVSVGALAAVPVLPAYSASKAAAFSVTQSLRALLAGRGVQVHAVLPGPIDTDMVRDLPIPKTAPEVVAQGIFDGVENGDEDIFPDAMSATMADAWRTGVAKQLERQNAALVQTQPIAA
jgi:NAD(P)-dependent dehydrogenase (short-subunit alcohol dehydrogenase family)